MSEAMVEQITARLNEIEAVARAATPGSWQAAESWAGPNAVLNEDGYPLAVCGAEAPGYDKPVRDATHIALHDPAAVLALVAGLREVVALHHRPPMCDACIEDYPCRTLTAVARALGLDAGGAA
jgi:hypothetical protein